MNESEKKIDGNSGEERPEFSLKLDVMQTLAPYIISKSEHNSVWEFHKYRETTAWCTFNFTRELHKIFIPHFLRRETGKFLQPNSIIFKFTHSCVTCSFAIICMWARTCFHSARDLWARRFLHAIQDFHRRQAFKIVLAGRKFPISLLFLCKQI